MRTLCDNCESAAALVFCAADEAALCGPCDKEVHMCNKLASRHLRVSLIDPCEFFKCDICENAHALFYCEKDGSSLCLQCDMLVHVGGKKGHNRYLLLRQKVGFPRELTPNSDEITPQSLYHSECQEETLQMSKAPRKLQIQSHNQACFLLKEENHPEDYERRELVMIDLNTRPHRTYGAANTQGMDIFEQ